jgi:hypothetical protein
MNGPALADETTSAASIKVRILATGIRKVALSFGPKFA